MKTIPLTQGKVAIVDDEDYEWLNQWKWYTIKNRHYFYAVRNIGKYPHQKRIRMHRQILNCPLGKQVDHKDHNGLDNRKTNIRTCSRTENIRYQRPQRRNKSSKFKGVYWLTKRKLWRAHIKYQGKTVYLGRFHNEIEAAKAYDKATKQYFGEFACLNTYGL